MKLDKVDIGVAAALVLLLAANGFTAFRVIDERSIEPDPPVRPAPAARAAPAPVTAPGDAQAAAPADGVSAAPSAPAAADGSDNIGSLKEKLQGAIFVAQALQIENGSYDLAPADLNTAMPDATFAGGVAAAGPNAIGVETTSTSILLVAQTSAGVWLCAAADGAAGTIYGEGDSLDAVNTIGSCSASSTGWGA